MSSLLDVARQTYKETNTDAAGLVTQLAGEHKLHTSLATYQHFLESSNLRLDLKYDSARQYYIARH